LDLRSFSQNNSTNHQAGLFSGAPFVAPAFGVIELLSIYSVSLWYVPVSFPVRAASDMRWTPSAGRQAEQFAAQQVRVTQ